MANQGDDKGISAHDEINSLNLPPTSHKFKFSSKTKDHDGDVALKLFANADDLHAPIDPAEEKKLIRKIDLLILPLIAVNYAFFYIDKTTLSYAAIFGIRDDLHLHGTQYNWLSSTSRSCYVTRTQVSQFRLQAYSISDSLPGHFQPISSCRGYPWANTLVSSEHFPPLPISYRVQPY